MKPQDQAGEVPEFFVNGIRLIEDVCGNLRFTLFAFHKPPLGETERRDVLALVMPTHAVTRSAMQASVAAAAAELDRVH